MHISQKRSTPSCLWLMGQNPAHTKISRSSGSWQFWSFIPPKSGSLGSDTTNPYGLVTKPEKVPWSSRPSLKRPPAPQCRAPTSDSWDSLEKRPAWFLPSHCDGRLARPDGLTMALSHRSSNFMALGWWWGWWWSVCMAMMSDGDDDNYDHAHDYNYDYDYNILSPWQRLQLHIFEIMRLANKRGRSFPVDDSTNWCT